MTFSDLPDDQKQKVLDVMGYAMEREEPGGDMKIPMRKCSHCDGTGLEQDDAAVGKAMASIRNNARLTLREMSKRMSLSVSYLSDLEHGRKFWSQSRIWDYMQAVAGKELFRV